MRQGFRLDHRLGEPRVQAQARWFEKNPAYLDRVFDRGSKYLFHIVESLEASGLPLEIALLPLVESASIHSPIHTGELLGYGNLFLGQQGSRV